jgi:uncharacterized protein (DUF433 family)
MPRSLVAAIEVRVGNRVAGRGYSGGAIRRSRRGIGWVRGVTLDRVREEYTMGWEERIELNPEVLAAKPIVKGTRLSVEFIVGLLADGWTEDTVLAEYPGLTREDIRACLRYASDRLQSEKVYPLNA